MATERLSLSVLKSGLNQGISAYDALNPLDAYVGSAGLDPQLLELLKVRASQLNGCAYCTDLHSKDALKVGVPQRQLLALTVWRESPALFDARARAVLGLTEAMTLLPDGVSDEVVAAVKAQFSETETAGWVMGLLL